MAYSKPWKSFDEQLAQLQERGLRIDDWNLARQHLDRIGYYRLSGYWHSFREQWGRHCPLSEQSSKPSKVAVIEHAVQERFKKGTCFQDAVALYVFDKQVRLLVLDALERIEIALRVDISHTLGQQDPFAYLNPDYFHASFSRALDPKTGLTPHHKWLSKHAELINRSKEEFVQHNRKTYGLPLAIWVACEVWDFGCLSTLFSGLRETEQDAIARQYGLSNGRIFATWLRSLNYLRNVCAHHSRLWNRNIADQPKLPPNHEISWVSAFTDDTHARARCFVLLCIVRHLLRIINSRSSWPGRVRSHLENFPPLSHVGLDLGSMGTPRNWQSVWA